MRFQPSVTFSRIALLMGTMSLAQAHFVFIVPEPGGSQAKVFINEELKPSQEVDIGMISGAKLNALTVDEKVTPLSLVKGTDAYTVALPGEGKPRLIYGMVDLGFSQSEGAKKPYLLLYYPKTILGKAFDGKTVVGGHTPVELVPYGEPGAVKLQLLVHGKPEANSEITVILPDGKQKKVKTDAQGQTEAFTQAGRYGAWARYWEPSSGERDGKKYEELRNYATLVFDTDSQTTSSATKPASISATKFATLPEATASFGAVVSNGWLYVYGGHVSPTHSYSSKAVSGQFHRLSLSGKQAWETLPAGPTLQGMNLAEYDGKVYRIGGMTPHNKPGEAADNYSVAECARFDPAIGKWEPLPPLPEPRSSHDVAVVNGKLIVTGGWTLRGKENQYRDTALVLDLNAKPLQWTSVPQPFKRRALTAAAYQNKLYAIGGFNEKEEIVQNVSVYDPKTNIWTEAVKLPEGPGLTFAPAAAAQGDKLYVSVSDGTLYRLNESAQKWEKAGSATPRLAHRIVSIGKEILVIGGAAKGNNSDLVEAIAVEQP